jgi:hypothetical protein
MHPKKIKCINLTYYMYF